MGCRCICLQSPLTPQNQAWFWLIACISSICFSFSISCPPLTFPKPNHGWVDGPKYTLGRISSYVKCHIMWLPRVNHVVDHPSCPWLKAVDCPPSPCQLRYESADWVLQMLPSWVSTLTWGVGDPTSWRPYHILTIRFGDRRRERMLRPIGRNMWRWTYQWYSHRIGHTGCTRIYSNVTTINFDVHVQTCLAML